MPQQEEQIWRPSLGDGAVLSEIRTEIPYADALKLGSMTLFIVHPYHAPCGTRSRGISGEVDRGELAGMDKG
jgi:hypothetical protein